MNDYLVMRNAGLTYSDVEKTSIQCGKSKLRTAIKLGVAKETLNASIKRFPELSVLFTNKCSRPRKRKITRQQLEELADFYLKKDAAYLLGISYSYTRELCRKWNVRFDNNKSLKRKIGIHGYAL